jgi:hypothetical protein
MGSGIEPLLLFEYEYSMGRLCSTKNGSYSTTVRRVRTHCCHDGVQHTMVRTVNAWWVWQAEINCLQDSNGGGESCPCQRRGAGSCVCGDDLVVGKCWQFIGKVTAGRGASRALANSTHVRDVGQPVKPAPCFCDRGAQEGESRGHEH